MCRWMLVLGMLGCGGDVRTGSVPPLVETREDCAEPVVWYLDNDEDGFGAANQTRRTCTPPVIGWSLRTGDCDDDDPGVYPGAIELCDGVDQDCDGRVDVDAVDAWRWYPDGDGDGAADTTAVPVRACEPPGELLREDAPVDCDDSDPSVHPGAEDVHCDNIDQDCDGTAQAVARVGPAAFDTVIAAVRAAEGESVSVCPGTHPVQDVRIEGNVTLSGVGDAVVLDGGGGRVLDVTGDRVHLQNVTLIGGEVSGDGVRVFGVDLSDGTASTRGGLLDIDVGGRTSLQLERCDLARGRAPGGGLVALGVGEDTVSLDIDDTTFSEGDAARGSALWVHTPLAARIRVGLDEVRVWDSRGGPAVELQVAPGEDPRIGWEGATSALQRNQGGGLRVSEPTADVRFARIELGELLDDNTGFDLDLGGTLYAWPADPWVWCQDEVCSVVP